MDPWISNYTYSEASIISVEGIIIRRQFSKIVVMMIIENSGWTSMWIATRRTGLKGDKNHKAFVAEKRNISFPLLMTTNVWNTKYMMKIDNHNVQKLFKLTKNICTFGLPWIWPILLETYLFILVEHIDVFNWCSDKLWRKLCSQTNW